MLFASDNVMRVFIDDYDNLAANQKREEFFERVKSHLFIDDTLIKKAHTYFLM